MTKYKPVSVQSRERHHTVNRFHFEYREEQNFAC